MKLNDWVRVGTLRSHLWTPHEDGSLPQPQKIVERQGRLQRTTYLNEIPAFGDTLGEIKAVWEDEDGPVYGVRFTVALQEVCQNVWWAFRAEDLVPAEPTQEEQFDYVLDWMSA